MTRWWPPLGVLARVAPIGAMVFNLMYDYALTRIRTRLRDAGLTLPLSFAAPHSPGWHNTAAPATPHAIQQCEVVDSTYVDDDLIMQADRSGDALKLVANAGFTLQVVIDEFRAAGLTINLGVGKTEIMLKLTGRGAVKAAQLVAEHGGRIYTPDGGSSCGTIDSYKHLGSMRTPTGNPILDARHRSAMALAAYAPLAHQVFGNKRIAVDTRLRLADALVFSRLFYGTGTWRKSTEGATAAIRSTYMRALRRIAGESRYGAVCNRTDVQVLGMLARNSADIVLRQKRLVAFPALLSDAGPLALRGLLRTDGPVTVQQATWASDLQWVWETSPKLVELPDPVLDPAPWTALIMGHPAAWCDIVRSAVGRTPSAAVPKEFLHVNRAEADELQALAVGRLFICQQCPADMRRCLGSRAALLSHCTRVHGHTCPIRPFVVDETCPACGKAFGNRRRALHHAAYSSKRCRAKLLSGDVPLPCQQLRANADAADRPLVRAAGRAGVSRCKG